MKINIKERKGHLYLDYLLKGKRKKEALGLTLCDDDNTNTLIWALANLIKIKREKQLGIDHIREIAKKWDLEKYFFKKKS